jgi:hypothetical protein
LTIRSKLNMPITYCYNNSFLVIIDLEQHDKAIGSPTKPKRAKGYRPVSSLAQERDLPRTPVDVDLTQMSLDDPPPNSTLYTYKHMRGTELRKLFYQRQCGMRTSRTHGSQPRLNPTKLSEKILYPSLTTHRTQPSSASADEFYDFDEFYVHDSHAQQSKTNGKPKAVKPKD